MQLKPLKELLAMSKEKIDEALAPIRSRQIRAKAELEMSTLDGEILTLEREVTEMCIEKEIDFKSLLNKLDEIAIKERRKKQYTKVLSQLFPKDK